MIFILTVMIFILSSVIRQAIHFLGQVHIHMTHIMQY